MKKSQKDIDAGIGAINQLFDYLENIQAGFASGKQDVINVYIAMKDNSIGWKKCFQTLQTKSDLLVDSMLKLGDIVDEVAKRCGIASRRKTVRFLMLCTFA